MRTFLLVLFTAILVAMLFVTTRAALDQNIWQAGGRLMKDRWFVATLVDAYLGFLTFYVWVAYRESSFAARLTWLVLIMTLGNIAMAVYMLIRTWKLQPSQPAWTLLLRDADKQRLQETA